MCLRTEKLQCLESEAVMYGTRLLSVSRQIGAHLWREVPFFAIPSLYPSSQLQHMCPTTHRDAR